MATLPRLHLQLTMACNMSCPHCNVGCSVTRRGEYIPPDILQHIYQNYPSSMYLLTGGEPTLHRDLFNIISTLSLQPCTKKVIVITNGKRTEIVKELFKLHRFNNKLELRLSIDQYHEPIDPDIEAEFRLNHSISELNFVVNRGSAAINGINTIAEGCSSPVPTVSPSGILTKCGCPNSTVLGSVSDITTLQRLHDYNAALCAKLGACPERCYLNS